MIYEGKEVLRIWDFLTEFEQWKKDNLYQIPLISNLANYSIFCHFLAIVNKIENSDFGKVVSCFLQSLHGINRAFNSYKYKDLINISNKELKHLVVVHYNYIVF